MKNPKNPKSKYAKALDVDDLIEAKIIKAKSKTKNAAMIQAVDDVLDDLVAGIQKAIDLSQDKLKAKGAEIDVLQSQCEDLEKEINKLQEAQNLLREI